MESMRAGWRLGLFLLFSLVIILLFCLGLPFCALKKERRVRWKNGLIQYWARTIARLLGMTICIKGTPPEPPFFMVSNHLGYVDILPFWGYLKTTFIAKSEIKGWPFFGQAARLLGIIFINRKNRKDIHRVNNIIEKNITEEQGIILFPEGTSSKGKRVLPFKSSLLYYPASKKLPVHYASISYHINGNSAHTASREICWWGDMDFLSHFWGLLKIKSWTVTVCFSDQIVINENRKTLSGILHQKVIDNFIPILN